MAAWMRTGILIVTLALAAIIGSFGALWLTSTRGGLGPTVLQANSPLVATISVVLVVAIATILGVTTARVTTAASGMFVVGFALFALTMRTQGVTDYIFSEVNTSLLALEAIVVAILILASSLVVFQMGGPLKDVPVNQQGIWDKAFSFRNIGMSLLLSIAILPIVWLVAASPSKGQVIGAASVGGVAVACLARKFTPHLQPILIFSVPTAIAAIGYAIANSMGISDIAFTQKTISPLIFPMPLEYAAGSIMGVAIGLSWASSFAEKGTPDTA